VKRTLRRQHKALGDLLLKLFLDPRIFIVEDFVGSRVAAEHKKFNSKSIIIHLQYVRIVIVPYNRTISGYVS
jgi:hypothetical protein